MNTITKADLAAAVAANTGKKPAEIKRIIDALTNEMSRRLSDGDQVILRGFGRFYATPISKGICNLPGQKGKPLPAKNKIKFRAAVAITDTVN